MYSNNYKDSTSSIIIPFNVTGLHGDQLENGKVYRCRLSGVFCLCNHEPLQWTQTQEGNAVTKFRVIMRYYNVITGLFVDINPIHYQFILAE